MSETPENTPSPESLPLDAQIAAATALLEKLASDRAHLLDIPEAQRTRLFGRSLLELDLLQPMRFDATLPDGRQDMSIAVQGGRIFGEWPGIARELLEDGQDLRVTTDTRDILAELVQRRLNNGNQSLIFPNYVPRFRGVFR